MEIGFLVKLYPFLYRYRHTGCLWKCTRIPGMG